MAGEVTVVATVKLKPEDQERALAILEGVIASTHGEDGCVKYTLHRATNEAGAFSIVEVPTTTRPWASLSSSGTTRSRTGCPRNWHTRRTSGTQETAVDYKNDDRAPLLFVSGSQDHIMPRRSRSRTPSTTV